MQELNPLSLQHLRILHELVQKNECLSPVLQPSQITYSGFTSAQYIFDNFFATFSKSL